MNPYEVLGVSENADEETIKKAYKELVKKYHPDKYINNPLADLAAEKMKEINKAYDMITHKTADSSQSGGFGSQTGYGSYGGYSTGVPSFQTVRQLLNMRRAVQAQAMLARLPRTAEWYYLSGLASIQQGWSTQGIKYLEQAVSMDPNNSEYRDMLNNIKSRAGSYSTGQTVYNTSGDCCSSLPCYCIPCMPCWCGC
ncbi:MAG: DnaJ domain-containing protein [Clostridiales bacterium]|nr:DnaJ domain-containing protein [Clostridiales bacterium]